MGEPFMIKTGRRLKSSRPSASAHGAYTAPAILVPQLRRQQQEFPPNKSEGDGDDPNSSFVETDRVAHGVVVFETKSFPYAYETLYV